MSPPSLHDLNAASVGAWPNPRQPVPGKSFRPGLTGKIYHSRRTPPPLSPAGAQSGLCGRKREAGIRGTRMLCRMNAPWKTSVRSMTLPEWGTLGFLSVLWGGSFFFIELGLRWLNPLTLVFARLGLAALALHVMLLALRIKLPNRTGPASPFRRAAHSTAHAA